MHPRKILLLSDGSEIFSVLDQVFSNEGYQTLIKHNSREAAQALRPGCFQLLITRASKDRHDSLTMLKSLRRQHPGLTALILRGEHEVNSPIEAYCLKVGEEVFIPCGWPGLRRLVASCLVR